MLQSEWGLSGVMDGDLILTTLVLGGALLVPGLLLGLVQRGEFHFRWLLVAVALVIVNDAALTNIYGLLPVVASGDYNWQGKILALALTLTIANSAAFDRGRSGLTIRQNTEQGWLTYAVIIITVLLFAIPSILFPNDPYTAEQLVFQATMPGLEEETFYRGILLLALNEAFTARRRIAGVNVGWGALLVTMALSLIHI